MFLLILLLDAKAYILNVILWHNFLKEKSCGFFSWLLLMLLTTNHKKREKNDCEFVRCRWMWIELVEKTNTIIG